MKLRKIDAILVASLLVVTGVFLCKAGYVSQIFSSGSPDPQSPSSPDITVPLSQPTPPVSLITTSRREVTAVDEGVHFDDLQVSRELWYFTAVFNDSTSSLQNWAVAVGFAHMARGDLLGTNKPDLLVVSLLGNDNQVYGGMINKQHYLGILKDGTLIADSPGVKIQYENSWAEGSFPEWRIHAESQDVDSAHTIVIDLEYHASALPVWTLGPQAFDDKENEITSYVILGCGVTGTVTIDGTAFQVKGTGSQEHSWTPHLILKSSLKAWDWFSFELDNGWEIYTTNYQPALGMLPRNDPFGTFLITSDGGATITELKDVTLTVTQSDERVFPLVKMPSAFTMEAYPSINMSYIISQSLLYGSETTIISDVEVTHSTNMIWRFPTYLGMKIGYCMISGTLSWYDDDGQHELPINGIGISWSMRSL